MRLFYAVTFSNETKEVLVTYRDMIANNSIKGRFTTKANFHLTLSFIGEVPEHALDRYLSILEGLEVERVVLSANFIGAFSKRQGEVIWMGLEKNLVLDRLHKQLKKHLIVQGMVIEERKFAPHITLGRQVHIPVSLENLIIEPLDFSPRSVALMESKREHGSLVYEVIEERLFPLV